MSEPPSTEEILARSDRFDEIEGDSPLWDSFDYGDHFDREGRQITLRQWCKLHDCREYVRVALDEIGPYRVSTVWLGIDHGFGGHAPIIFETMVFKEDESDLDCRRYSTLRAAQIGHAEMVTEVKLFAQL